MISVVLINMDDVIVNGEPVFQQIEKEMFRDLGIQIETEIYRSFVGLKTLQMWESIVDRCRLPHHPVDLDREEEKRFLDSVHLRCGMLPVYNKDQRKKPILHWLPCIE